MTQFQKPDLLVCKSENLGNLVVAQIGGENLQAEIFFPDDVGLSWILHVMSIGGVSEGKIVVLFSRRILVLSKIDIIKGKKKADCTMEYVDSDKIKEYTKKEGFIRFCGACELRSGIGAVVAVFAKLESSDSDSDSDSLVDDDNHYRGEILIVDFEKKKLVDWKPYSFNANLPFKLSYMKYVSPGMCVLVQWGDMNRFVVNLNNNRKIEQYESSKSKSSCYDYGKGCNRLLEIRRAKESGEKKKLNFLRLQIYRDSHSDCVFRVQFPMKLRKNEMVTDIALISSKKTSTGYRKSFLIHTKKNGSQYTRITKITKKEEDYRCSSQNKFVHRREIIKLPCSNIAPSYRKSDNVIRFGIMNDRGFVKSSLSLKLIDAKIELRGHGDNPRSIFLDRRRIIDHIVPVKSQRSRKEDFVRVDRVLEVIESFKSSPNENIDHYYPHDLSILFYEFNISSSSEHGGNNNVGRLVLPKFIFPSHEPNTDINYPLTIDESTVLDFLVFGMGMSGRGGQETGQPQQLLDLFTFFQCTGVYEWSLFIIHCIRDLSTEKLLLLFKKSICRYEEEHNQGRNNLEHLLDLKSNQEFKTSFRSSLSLGCLIELKNRKNEIEKRHGYMKFIDQLGYLYEFNNVKFPNLGKIEDHSDFLYVKSDIKQSILNLETVTKLWMEKIYQSYNAVDMNKKTTKVTRKKDSIEFFCNNLGFRVVSYPKLFLSLFSNCFSRMFFLSMNSIENESSEIVIQGFTRDDHLKDLFLKYYFPKDGYEPVMSMMSTLECLEHLEMYHEDCLRYEAENDLFLVIRKLSKTKQIVMNLLEKGHKIADLPSHYRKKLVQDKVLGITREEALWLIKHSKKTRLIVFRKDEEIKGKDERIQELEKEVKDLQKQVQSFSGTGQKRKREEEEEEEIKNLKQFLSSTEADNNVINNIEQDESKKGNGKERPRKRRKKIGEESSDPEFHPNDEEDDKDNDDD